VGKPTPANAGARQDNPPEVADADIATKPSEGAASTPTTPESGSGRVAQVPNQGTSS